MPVIINGSTGITDVNGTAAAPAITGTDTDTGVFFGTNTVSLSTGGTERLQIDSSGNLGLGVTPSAWATSYKAFQIGIVGRSLAQTGAGAGDLTLAFNAIYSSANSRWDYAYTGDSAVRYSQTGSGVHAWYTAASGTAGNAITFTQAMTLDASGNLFLGTTGITGGLNGNVINLFGTGTVRNIVQTTGQYSVINMGSGGTSTTPTTTGYLLTDSSANTFNVYTGTSTPLLFGTNNTERARIDSSGNLLVGATNASSITAGGFFVEPNAQASGVPAVYIGSSSASSSYQGYSMYYTGAGAGYKFYVLWNGTINAVTTTITAISDQRLKENIRDLDDGLDVVMALKPRKFDWKEGKGADIKNARGFIAQEFEQVLPDMISEWQDPAPEGEEPYKAINANLIPTLVKAIQEQQAIITQLQADVAALKGQA